MSDDAHPELVALGKAWIAAWNARDLEQVLALYADDAEMTSDGIVRLGFAVQGSVRGKQNLRAYWSKALALLPNLHFEAAGFFTSPNSLVVHYTNDRGQTICEYLRVGLIGANAGLIVQGSANHLEQAA
jgi:hypothetical protein